MQWKIPLHIISPNVKMHWTKRYKQTQSEQIALLSIKHEFKACSEVLNPPWIITMTRVSPRPYDDDNCILAFKHIKDYLAHLIMPAYKMNKKTNIMVADMGRNDNHPNFIWKYEQEKGIPNEYAIKIKIE